MDDDLRLVRAMARHDRSAWSACYERHVRDVYGLIYHLVGGDHQVAEEVNQDVWLLAIERFDGFDPARGGLRDWLLGIARHRAFRQYRRSHDQADQGRRDGMSVGLSPPELLEGRERVDVVRAALLCLRDGSRKALLARYAEGLPIAEIAARTGRSTKAVESLLSRARSQLRDLLRTYFSPPTGDQRCEPIDSRST
jgi:RNA polymerase sigma-70 factor (ECF subfamily)